MVGPAPPGFDGGLALDPGALRGAGEVVNGGLHAVVTDAVGDHRIWLQQRDGSFTAAFYVPIDEHFPQRVQSMQRFYRWLHGKATGPPPRYQQLSAYQRHRCVLMLRAWDATEAGASRRQLASVLLNNSVLTMRAIDWKNAAERRRVNRLLAAARAMVNGDYLRLLQNAPLPVHLFRSR
ncbi:DUF2285 domain-containing protein [Hyphomicrobium sp.]|uniref:DUF2285 domain-containing protein n=1 Tax=Hyphomicrobium sp. TaxID=82 RepID=UPI003FA59E1D